MKNRYRSLMLVLIIEALGGCTTTTVSKTNPAAVQATAFTADPGVNAALLPAPVKPHETFVLVHGAWAGGWEWKKVATLLQQDGNIVYRPTLTGQGERVHLATPNVDLNTHIDDVVNLILYEDLHDVVLMGHSYGGMVIAGVVDRIPDRIKAVVYVDAFVPNDGDSIQSLTGRNYPAVNGFVPTPGQPLPANAPAPHIVPMSTKVFITPEVLKNSAAAKIPGTYILCVKPGQTVEQAGFYKDYTRAAERGYFKETIESDHVVNQSHPEELVKLLESAASLAEVHR